MGALAFFSNVDKEPHYLEECSSQLFSIENYQTSLLSVLGEGVYEYEDTGRKGCQENQEYTIEPAGLLLLVKLR